MSASVLSDMILLFTDFEAEFRLLVALGTLISETKQAYIKDKILDNKELIEKIKKFSSQNNETDQKLMKCAKEVQSVFLN